MFSSCCTRLSAASSPCQVAYLKPIRSESASSRKKQAMSPLPSNWKGRYSVCSCWLPSSIPAACRVLPSTPPPLAVVVQTEAAALGDQPFDARAPPPHRLAHPGEVIPHHEIGEVLLAEIMGGLGVLIEPCRH